MTLVMTGTPAMKPKVFKLPAAAPKRALRTSLARRALVKIRDMQATLLLVCIIVIIAIAAVSTNQNAPKGSARGTGMAGMLNAPISNAMASNSAAEQDKTIVIQGKTDAIVGQMTKFPATDEQGSEIKTISKVDNNTGRALLSIISKY